MPAWAAGLLTSLIAAVVALTGAWMMRRTTKEVEGAKTQASENAVLLKGFTDFVQQAREDRSMDRAARLEAIRERDEAIQRREDAIRDRDAVRAELNALRRQLENGEP